MARAVRCALTSMWSSPRRNRNTDFLARVSEKLGGRRRRRAQASLGTVVFRALSSLPVPLIPHRHLPSPRLGVALIAVALTLGAAHATETWRGLVVAPEYRCSPYDRDDYPYPQSVERDIVRALGGRVYGPYTGTHFSSRRETDIEHMVATSEAHDSGLCAVSAATRARFARDLDNLTLASPRVNRHEKKAKDAAQWLPERNRCWFAARVVAVKRKYGLSVDAREAAALEAVLRGCTSTDLVVYAPSAGPATPPSQAHEGAVDALARWDDNGNGRITCAEARRHGIAPVPRGHPAYPHMKDGDGDGVVCE